MNKFEDLIKDLFRKQNCKAGQIILIRTIDCVLLQNLNPEDKKKCIEAINNLIESGFCTYKTDRLQCLCLTETGYDGLYPKRSQKELEDLVMSLFSESKCDVGQGVMYRKLETLIRSLNPEDANNILGAVDKLIEQGFISSSSNFLSLTQKGYDRIYK